MQAVHLRWLRYLALACLSSAMQPTPELFTWSDCTHLGGTSVHDGPEALVFDPASGNVYVADTQNSRIIRWSSGTGVQVAGNGQSGSATNQTSYPSGILLQESTGELIMAVSDGPSSGSLMKWTPGDSSGEFFGPSLQFQKLAWSHTGEILSNTVSGTSVYRTDPLTGITEAVIRDNNSVSESIKDVAVASTGQIFVLHDDKVVEYMTSEVLLTNKFPSPPYALAVDGKGRFWIGAHFALVRCEADQDACVYVLGDLSIDNAADIVFDPDYSNFYVLDGSLSNVYRCPCLDCAPTTTTSTTATATTSTASTISSSITSTDSSTTTASLTSSSSRSSSTASSTTSVTSSSSSTSSSATMRSTTSTASNTPIVTGSTTTTATISRSITAASTTTSLTSSSSSSSSITASSSTSITSASSTASSSTTSLSSTASNTSSTASSTSSTSSSTSSTSSTSTASNTSTMAVTTLSGATSTTSSTTSSTTASSTSTTTVSGVPPGLTLISLADLVELVESASTGLLMQLQGGEDEATTSLPGIPGGSLTALALGTPSTLANSSGDEIEVSLATAGGRTEIAIPQEVFSGLPPGGSLALVVSFFSTEVVGSLGEGQRAQALESSGELVEVELQAISAVSIELRDLLSGQTVRLLGLQRPIVFQLPGVNFTAGLHCAYLQEDQELWSFEGVETPAGDNKEGGPLICHTFHLSFFAALLRSYVATFECAQFSLLSAAAVQNLFIDNSWMLSWSGWICWAELATVLLLGCIATVMDCRRAWQDEHFLLAVQETAAEDSGDSEDTELAHMHATAREGGYIGHACLRCLWASIALREALDDVMSSWCVYWKNVRRTAEALNDAFLESADGISATCSRLAQRSAAILLLASSRRLAAASMGLSNEAVAFLLEDEDLRDYITDSPSRDGAAACKTPPSDCKTSEQFVVWTTLHDELIDHFLAHTHRHRARQLPKMAMEFVAFHNPISALFLNDIFHSCKKRVLLLAVDLAGALVMSCVFFNAAGMVRGKPLRTGQNCGGDGSLTWRLGRFAAFATGSLVVSGLPRSLIESLHTKRLCKVDFTGSKAWERQLRIWATQDRTVWIVGCLYVAFCNFFVIVFLASIGPDDRSTWRLLGLLVLAEDFVIIPLVLAIALPAATTVFLRLLSRAFRTDHCIILRHSQESILQRTNLMTPIARI